MHLRIAPRLTLLSKRFSSTFRFDAETVVKAHETKPHTFVGHVGSRWSVGDAPNGGMLMTMAINAAKNFVHHPDPLSFTAYYVNKALENAPVELSVRVISKSKSSTTVHVNMLQDGILRSEYMGIFGTLDTMRGLNFSKKTPFPLPPRKDCFNASTAIRKAYGKHLAIANEIELRIPPNDPFVTGVFQRKPGNEAALHTWVRFEDHRPPCINSLPFFQDALPPPVVNLTPSHWVPTLEFTVHFWGKPVLPDDKQQYQQSDDDDDLAWLQSKTETTYVQNGLLYTDGEVWSHDGKRLLATSRQLARVLDPR